MTSNSPSRATLQDVLKAIDDAHDLNSRRKQDMRSAVRLIAKAIGLEPQQILADPRGLGNALGRISPRSLGLSDGRWANCRSLLRAAMRLVRPTMAGASKQPVLLEWEHLAVEARKNGSCWLRLCRLVRWLSARQIGPNRVTHADLEQYRSEYLSDALLGNPEQSWQATRQSWERMRNACPAWPQVTLAKAVKPTHYCLPWSAFPSSLKAEVDRLLLRLAGHDLTEDGPVRPLRPATLRTRDYELRVLASALVHKGIAAEALTSLAFCLSVENYKLGLQWLYEQNGSKARKALHNTAADLKAIAKHWLKADQKTLEVMAKIVRRLAAPVQGMGDKNRERLRPFESEETLRRFSNLPRTICRHIETNKNAKARRIGLATAALASEILLNAPLRLSNLAGLRMDRHFVKFGDKTFLVIPREEVKNGVELEFELPTETIALVNWYIDNHRRAIPGNPFLFAGKGMGAKCHGTLAAQLCGTVRDFMGLVIHPHLFRHIAATIYLKAHPGQYEVVRLLLGHRRIQTTTAIYAAQEERGARLHFAGVLRQLRESEAFPTSKVKGKAAAIPKEFAPLPESTNSPPRLKKRGASATNPQGAKP